MAEASARSIGPKYRPEASGLTPFTLHLKPYTFHLTLTH